MLKQISTEELEEVLRKHKLWIENGDNEYGEKAELSGYNLRHYNLSGVNLSYADLSYTDLSYTELSYTNLTGSDLSCCNLMGSNLNCSNLRCSILDNSDLRGANLEHCDLSLAHLRNSKFRLTNLMGSNLANSSLRGVDLTNVIYDEITSFLALQCPEKGSFIGYKKAGNKIVELLITEDSKRSSSTSRKCRCSKAKVLSIESIDKKEIFQTVASSHDYNFVYEVGKIVEVKDFDEDRWKECSTGIHFFITRGEAELYY